MTEEREKLIEEIAKEDYTYLTWLLDPNQERMLCGIGRFIYTVGLVIGIDETGYFGRYCFEHHADAVEVLLSLTKIPDDLREMGGNWIKFKGYTEFSNDKYEKHETGNYQEII